MSSKDFDRSRGTEFLFGVRVRQIKGLIDVQIPALTNSHGWRGSQLRHAMGVRSITIVSQWAAYILPALSRRISTLNGEALDIVEKARAEMTGPRIESESPD